MKMLGKKIILLVCLKGVKFKPGLMTKYLTAFVTIIFFITSYYRTIIVQKIKSKTNELIRLITKL